MILIIILALIFCIAGFFLVRNILKGEDSKLRDASIVGLAGLALVGGLLMPASPGYIIDGNTVYVNNSKAYISATPATIVGHGFVEFTLLSKTYTGPINILLRFTEDDAPPLFAEYYNPNNRTVEHSRVCDTTNNTRYYNAIPGLASCYNSTNDELLWTQEFDRATPVNDTIYWDVEETIGWTSLSGQFQKTTNVFGQDTVYYKEGVNVQAGVERKFRVYIATKVGASGKYDFAAWPTSYGLSKAGIRAADDAGNLLLLDPFYDDSPYGTFCDPSTESTTQSDYLNFTGFEETGAPGGWVTFSGSPGYDATSPVYAGSESLGGGTGVSQISGLTQTGIITYDSYIYDPSLTTIWEPFYLNDRWRLRVNTGGAVQVYEGTSTWLTLATINASTWYKIVYIADFSSGNASAFLYADGGTYLGGQIDFNPVDLPQSNPHLISGENNEGFMDNFRAYTGSSCPTAPSGNNDPNSTPYFVNNSNYVGASVQAFVNWTDADNDPVNITWSVQKNGTTISSGTVSAVNNQSTSVYNFTAEFNNQYTLYAQVSDGTGNSGNISNTTGIFGNIAPTSTPYWVNDSDKVGANIEALVNWTDGNNHPVNITWSITQNGTTISSGVRTGITSNDTVSLANLTASLDAQYVVYAEVTDNYEDSANESATTGVFTNLVPTSTPYWTNTSSFAGSTARAFVNWTDGDNHPVNITWSVTKNGTTVDSGVVLNVNNNNTVSLYNTTTAAGDSFIVYAQTTDGYESSANESASAGTFQQILQAEFCSGIYQLDFSANISRGTYFVGPNVYYELDIVAQNTTTCTYVLNNTDVSSLTYTISNDLATDTVRLYANDLWVNSTTSRDFVVAPGNYTYINITLDLVNVSLTTATIDPNVSWSTEFT